MLKAFLHGDYTFSCEARMGADNPATWGVDGAFSLPTLDPYGVKKGKTSNSHCYQSAFTPSTIAIFAAQGFDGDGGYLDF